MQWYVLHVETGKEIAIKNCICNLEITSIVPREVVLEKRQGKFERVTKVLIPSYVFVQVALEPKIYYKLGGINGVFRWLGDNGPQPVPDSEMSFIFQLCDESELVNTSAIKLLPGKNYAIVSGPLRGREGQIVKIDWRHRRVTIKMPLFSREHELSLGIDILGESNAGEPDREHDPDGQRGSFEPFVRLEDGEPCSHPGCLNHVSHPCEGCRRIAGRC